MCTAAHVGGCPTSPVVTSSNCTHSCCSRHIRQRRLFAAPGRSAALVCEPVLLPVGGERSEGKVLLCGSVKQWSWNIRCEVWNILKLLGAVICEKALIRLCVLCSAHLAILVTPLARAGAVSCTVLRDQCCVTVSVTKPAWLPAWHRVTQGGCHVVTQRGGPTGWEGRGAECTGGGECGGNESERGRRGVGGV